MEIKDTTAVWGFEWPRNNSIFPHADSGCFGCSHTWGVGNDYNEAWPYLLNSNNFGFPGGSINFISRVIQEIIQEYSLKKVYILYPNWTRFEYLRDDNKWDQSLPTDENRYKFKEQNDDKWLLKNHESNKNKIRQICHDSQVKLIDLELEDLHPIIDYPDKWPKARDGGHWGPQWHQWVAEIFKNEETNR